MKNKECIICGGKDFQFLFEKNHFRIEKCKQCSLICTNLPESHNPANIYDQTYFDGTQKEGYSDYISTEKILKIEFKKTLDFILNEITPTINTHLLEVGSAYGFFLDLASAHFKVTGVEIAKNGVDFSINRGHNVYCGNLTSSLLEEIKQVDIAVMLDVIEHLENPNETLSLISRALPSNGFIVITTGDIGSLYARIAKNKWRLMTPPQHLFFFSKKTIKDLLIKNDFTNIKIYYRWKRVPLSLIFFQLLRRTEIETPNWLQKFFNNVYLPLNLFDAMTIIAEKK